MHLIMPVLFVAAIGLLLYLMQMFTNRGGRLTIPDSMGMTDEFGETVYTVTYPMNAEELAFLAQELTPGDVFFANIDGRYELRVWSVEMEFEGSKGVPGVSNSFIDFGKGISEGVMDILSGGLKGLSDNLKVGAPSAILISLLMIILGMYLVKRFIR